MEILFEKYIDKIKDLPDGKLSKEDILNDKFKLGEYKDMQIFYAPHNEYKNNKAKILIVGICPGWTQTEIAYRTAKTDLDNNKSVDDILKHCKEEARFAGSMRKNLIAMLDELNLNDKFNINSSSKLFEENESLHTTSLIPYPVFIKGKNYTGHSPSISDSPFLMEYIENFFYSEIKSYRKMPLIIPLGKAVEDVLKLMIEKNIINENECLFGFPHPSGANGHRKEQFNENKELLIEKINSYFKVNR